MDNENKAGSIQDAKLEIIKRHCDQLKAYFDTVQIFCTKDEPERMDGTVRMAFGIGNYYARFGQVKMWIKGQEFDEERNR